MSRTPRSHSPRPFVVAGFLGLSGLAGSAATSQAQSISPERALLNAIPAAGYGMVAVTESPSAIDGDRALLNQSIVVSGAANLATGSSGEAGAVDGEQALLGGVASVRRRLTLAW